MMVSHGDFGIACFQTKPDLNTVISWSANLFEQVAPPWATTNLEKLGESSDPREEYNTLIHRDHRDTLTWKREHQCTGGEWIWNYQRYG